MVFYGDENSSVIGKAVLSLDGLGEWRKYQLQARTNDLLIISTHYQEGNLVFLSEDILNPIRFPLIPAMVSFS